ncbi:MAG: ABC transporter ATP-binding protein [Candidatus Auribacterota bacterium]|nr:ABC transporter ATP-binding protein [Candidatus Auribacterota bacterium]
MTEYAVRMRKITKRFGALVANDQVSLDLRRGSIHGLLGENGAGKTTLMNILYGLYHPDQGEIEVDGQSVRIDSPLRAMELDIGMVHQHFMLVRPFTVTENIVLGLPSARRPFLDLKAASRRIEELSERYQLKIDPSARIWQLSVGEAQRVEILKNIYLDIRIMILDEPTTVLTPPEIEELFQIMRLMKEDGKSIILITHKLEEILAVTDEISVLRDGKQVGNVPTARTTRDELTRMMVGRDVLFDFSREQTRPGRSVLKARRVSALGDKGLPALREISFEVREGEILGVAGVAGNGQKELCQVLSGLRPVTSGQVFLGQDDFTGRPPKEFIDNQMAYIPEDRQETGLVMDAGLARNFIIKNFDRRPFSRHGFLNFSAIKENAGRLIEEFNVKTVSGQALAKDLSGGNQQKVVLAREISSSPEILIANQPTQGLDVGATEYVRQSLLDQRGRGVGVLLISADLEEIFQLSDRIAVIYNGEIMDIIDRQDARLEQVGRLMAGSREEGAA